MYQETYEDYIRSILGYPNYSNNNQTMPVMKQNREEMAEVEGCYPEIYKVVYPMVNKACSTNTRPVTAELVEELTNEIYQSVENDNEINVTINLNNEVSGVSNHRSNMTNASQANVIKSEKKLENRGEDRQFRNRGLQDLIRILLIRELLGRPGNRPHRPPMPPHRPPMRPPFPPGNPGGPRPPIMPRSDGYYDWDLYEQL